MLLMWKSVQRKRPQMWWFWPVQHLPTGPVSAQRRMSYVHLAKIRYPKRFVLRVQVPNQNSFFPKNHLCCSGVIRECFSTSFKLGQRSQPVQVTPFCQLQRTQSDASSSIRACICTEDFCNDEPADSNQIGNPGNKTITDLLLKSSVFI